MLSTLSLGSIVACWLVSVDLKIIIWSYLRVAEKQSILVLAPSFHLFLFMCVNANENENENEDVDVRGTQMYWRIVDCRARCKASSFFFLVSILLATAAAPVQRARWVEDMIVREHVASKSNVTSVSRTHVLLFIFFFHVFTFIFYPFSPLKLDIVLSFSLFMFLTERNKQKILTVQMYRLMHGILTMYDNL